MTALSSGNVDLAAKMTSRATRCFLLCALGFVLLTSCSYGQSPQATAPVESAPRLVIIDTDIGDDVDDAFAVALALQSPELKILGITAAWGNTPLRAKLLARFLRETGRTDIPIAMGTEKYPAKGKLNFSQAEYAERGPAWTFPAAVDFLLAQIRQHPGEITLIAIGPETNLGEAIDRDPDTFRELKRVVTTASLIRPESRSPSPSGIFSAIFPRRRSCSPPASRFTLCRSIPRRSSFRNWSAQNFSAREHRSPMR
jgi:hypothetical protein